MSADRPEAGAGRAGALHLDTLTISEGYDPQTALGAAKPPLYPSSTFVYRSAQDAKDAHRLFFDGAAPGGPRPAYIYSRLNHPNLDMVERRLAALDGAADAAVFASGMAAISTTLLAFVRPGDSVLYSRPLYGGADMLLNTHLTQFGVFAEGFSDGANGPEIRRAADAARARGPLALIWAETPANPTAAIVDLRLLREVADAIAAQQGQPPLIVADNTFLGPFLQSPLREGADLCMTSLTKYCGGHSDLLAGGVSGDAERIGALKALRTLLGCPLDAQSCWLLLRSFETLHIRTARACDNARAVAIFLRAHPKVESVTYLGFLRDDTPAGAAFARQCRGAGSTFSFRIRGGEDEAFRLLDQLRVLRLAVSLGGAETLICHPASTTHYAIARARREEVGITDATLRVSIGLEHPDDLIADLARGLDAI